MSIAEKYGFFWETLWNHPNNAELKKKREDPTILYPGDVVFVPEKRLKEVSEPTNQVHKFRVKNVPVKFSIRLLDDDDSPRANLNYILEIDGKEFTGMTDGNGAIRISIPPEAKKGKLILTDENEEYDLYLGHLDPIEKISGVQARLKGLGYYNSETSQAVNPETEQAVKDFQEAYKLEPTGQIDDAFRSKLESIYGS
ncbi:MAG: peptidoglycan-binding domain-containing protein [Actinomycetota bacterium]